MRFGPRALIHRFGGVVVTLLALGPGVIVAAPPAQAYTPSVATVAAYEAQVIQQINYQRVKYHRGKLFAGSCADVYAERWGAYLARTGTFYHQSMYPILRGCRATVAAENLARGNVNVAHFITAWMLSAGHRRNILDGRLTRIGVCAVYSGGQWTVATDFTRS